MRRKHKNKIVIAMLAAMLAGSFAAFAQDTTKNELVLTVSYFMNNNKMMYLMVNTKTKIDKKFQPVAGMVVNLCLDNDSAGNLIGKVITDEKGLAKAIIPPGLKNTWNNAAAHTFIGKSETTKQFDETTSEAAITKTKIAIDTLAGAEARTITVSVSALIGSEWVPAKDVEMKVGVARSGGILSAGDEETYTTDSTGTVNAAFKRDSLPGDEKGNIILAAKVEDNDQYGNLLVEKTVPWGVALKPEKNFFDQRTLWTTRFRTPLWLLFMAYSIVIGVWGTIIYLVWQIVKIKKLGLQDSQNNT
jgi:hypothetical protein